MSRIPSVGSIQSPAPETTRGVNDLRDLGLDQFLRLLITELQNQDPLDPLDNSEILQQISQIREIGATNLLTETLQSVLTGQNLATASGLIGKEVAALTDSGDNLQGVIDRVSVEVDDDGGNRTLKVHIGEQSVELNNIREIFEQEIEDATP